MEEPRIFAVIGNEGTNNTTSLPLTAPKNPSTTAVNAPKGKVRAAFSESQMNALVQRFSIQKYLTPGEMKSLGEITGLTYKQVRDLRSKTNHHKQNKMYVPFLISWDLLHLICRLKLGFRTGG